MSVAHKIETHRFFDIDEATLLPFLVDDPKWIGAGLPDVVVHTCLPIVENFTNLGINPANVGKEEYAKMVGEIVRDIFELFCKMVLNRPILALYYPQAIDAGTAAYLSAKADLTRYNAEGLTDEERAAIPDWDEGMMVCAIIKASVRAALGI